MPRITTVAKCRKSPGTCDACGKEIAKGEGYKWFAFFRSSAKCRHLTCPSWKQSQMTGSGPESAFLAACENAEENVDGWDGEDLADLKSIMEEAASEIREAANEFEDAAQNIEDGFQHETEVSQQFRDRAQEINEFADTVEAFEGEDFDGEVDADEDDEPTLKEFVPSFEGEIETEEAKAEREAHNENIQIEADESKSESEAAAEQQTAENKAEWADQQREAAKAILSEQP